MNQPVPGVLEVRMQYLFAGERAENVYHVHKGLSTAWGDAQIEDVLSTFEDWETTSSSLLRPTDVSLVNMIGSDLTSLNALRRSRAVVPAVNGAVVSDSLPNNATIAVKYDTGNRGRGQNGRQFWIGLAENQVDANTLHTAARDNIVTSLQTLLANIETLDSAYRLVVVHRVVNGTHPAVAGTSNILSFGMADLTIDTQKNRLPGHKRNKR